MTILVVWDAANTAAGRVLTLNQNASLDEYEKWIWNPSQIWNQRLVMLLTAVLIVE